MKKLIGYIAKQIYRKKYFHLKIRLLEEYEYVKIYYKNNFDNVSKLLISGEDHRFYYHIGFDLIAILRAIRNRAVNKKIEGASTIEQQLVRVLTNNYDKTYGRKIQEIFLSTTISFLIPKSEIPKVYLHVAYYGHGMNGLKQTLKTLGISQNDDISIEKAAEIVSRIKYPQPHIPNQKRFEQINIRKQHLIKLYNNHINYKFFKIYE